MNITVPFIIILLNIICYVLSNKIPQTYNKIILFMIITIINPLIIRYIYQYHNPYFIDTVPYLSTITLCLITLNVATICLLMKTPLNYSIVIYASYALLVLFIMNYICIGTFKIGLSHSLSGPMASSEKPLKNIELMLIDKVNSNGGINGKKIIPYICNSMSTNDGSIKCIEKFREQNINTIFGGWTSSSRKAMKPLLEKYNMTLFYPLQYEGEECSKNIIYTGSTPNQQINVAVEWAFNNLYKKFYLVGSDYVFPRTANQIMKNHIKQLGGTIVGEEYIALDQTNVDHIMEDLKEKVPPKCVILNTINGDANISFFKTLKKTLKCDVPIALRYPVLSFSFGEVGVKNIGIENCVGNYCCFSYFQSIDNNINKQLVKEYQDKYGKNQPIEDPMESAYIGLNLWMKHKATKQDLYKLEFESASGTATIHRNNHISKKVRIGRIDNNGEFDIMYETTGSIYPEPWNTYLHDRHYSCDHRDRGWGPKYSGEVTNYCKFR